MVNWKFNTILKNSILYFLVSEPTRLPNIGYLGGGYDIYKGNPREIGSVDPGFRLEPIFNLTLDGGITPDGRYILPKGVVAELCISCVIDFSTDYVKNIHDYRKELDKSISGSASSFFGKFSASRSYKDVYKKTEEQEKKFTMNEANCALYCMKGLTFLPRELSDDFKVAVELLSNNSDDPIYYEFINAFGTHYVHSMKMGTSTSAFIKAGIDVKNGEKNELAKKFESYSEKSHIHSTGASLPSTGEMKD
ncbi:20464_t:CDS:2 [Funneliformis geosporum]|uniref:16501_t:CDS:1 n=1 Tax=Funneliformis geosporum TaxID=1117311 RepID=A0A9W4SWW2_9GLOM|nr:20464_t:CDS:2 [Funneliformis geosporum]CAI2183835.1 16501_t:CDS:2 [Funneliformis geosporum]